MTAIAYFFFFTNYCFNYKQSNIDQPFLYQIMHSQLRQLLRFAYSPYPKSISLKSTGPTFTTNNIQKTLRTEFLDLPGMTADVLLFGKHHSDHIASVFYDDTTGWSDPIIKPFENLKVSPFVSSLHYGIQCFEGLKAYKSFSGQIRLFRPECNALRLKRSSVRLSLPDFDGEELVNLISEYVRVEERWVPPIPEFSFYIRPLHIAWEETLGIKKPRKSKLMIMGGPVGPYYPTGFKPVSLSCMTTAVRSAPKGTGGFKIGGNYGPTLQASSTVIAEGYQQVLWLWEDKIIEVGASNIFFIFKDKSGQIEIVTPDLQDMVLPGVTRDSILELLRDQKKYKVSERQLHMKQVLERHKRGELLECFGAGTAVIVSGVKEIYYEGHKIQLMDDNSLIGPIAHEIRQKVLGIQQGRLPDKYGWIRVIKK